jgi:hypothetical protein
MTQPRRRGRGSSNGRPDAIDLSIMGIVSDGELLAIVDDLADENGWTTTYAIRLQIGEHPEDVEQATRSGVGPKLSWFVRYGWAEKGSLTDKDEAGRRYQTYRLTAMGHALLDHPDLTATFQRTFDALNAAQRLALTRQLAEGGASSPDEIRVALRRQWVRSLGR